MSPVIPGYLDLLDQQREVFFRQITGTSPELLWKPPGEKKWSPGEHIDHCRVLLRSFRRIFIVCWPLGYPIARLRLRRPYATDIDDVYERPGFPLNVGWLWKPEHSASRPLGLQELQDKLASEHAAIRHFYSGKEEYLLGHVSLYDPVIGWLNLIQALRVGIYHDAHHFRIAAKWLQAVD